MNKINRLIDNLKNNHTSGAGDLVFYIINTLLDLTSSENEPDFLLDTVLELKTVRATMIAIENCADYIHKIVKSAFKKTTDSKKRRKTILNKLLKFKSSLSNSKEVIADNFSKQLKGRKKIVLFTYSYSSTVKTALLKNKNKIKKVILSESRPVFEGKKLAEILLKNNIKVTFITESQWNLFLPQADIVVLGADMILKDKSVINKTGSYTISLLADKFSIPVYVLYDFLKINNRLNYKDIKLKNMEKKDGSEIWDFKHKNLEIENYYFDITPANLITCFITDKKKL